MQKGEKKHMPYPVQMESRTQSTVVQLSTSAYMMQILSFQSREWTVKHYKVAKVHNKEKQKRTVSLSP